MFLFAISKNIEEDDALKQLMIDILINSQSYSFSPNVPIINKGTTYGIIKERNNKIAIHNKIYEIFFLLPFNDILSLLS